MIVNMLSALALALVIVAYWVLCRRRALRYQKKAVELIEEYFEDRGVPEADKDSLYRSYRLSRKFYMLPLCAMACPFVLAYMLIAKGKLDIKPTQRVNNKLYDAAFDQCMKMTISKNPISSILAIALIGLSFAFAIPVGVILNRLSSMPTAAGIANLFATISSVASRKAHGH